MVDLSNPRSAAVTMLRVAEPEAARVPRLESHTGIERNGMLLSRPEPATSTSPPASSTPTTSTTSTTSTSPPAMNTVILGSPPPQVGPRSSLSTSALLNLLDQSEPTTIPPRLRDFDPPLPVHVSANRDLSGNLLLDRYRLLKKLGEGGMGTVYLAEHVTIKKRCAIKLLNPEFAHKQDLVERFLQEARAASMIAHEHVVEITDFGASHGSVFFVMEMLIGEDLSDTIRRDAPMPWSRVAPIALQICRALAAAHGKGIVHRDMKPENCFRIERHGNSDFIKVLDFGIAKVTSDEPGEGTGPRLTSTGMIFGTPTYMSPEQAQGQSVDLRSDIYALGVILYELLTGKVPFSADNFMGILTKHMFDEPMAPSEAAPHADICPQAEALVLKCLQKDREYRFQSMAELSAAILDVGTSADPVTLVPEARTRPISEGRPTAFLTRSSSDARRLMGEVTLAQPRRRRGWLVAVAAGAAVLVGSMATWLLMHDETPTVPPVVVARAIEPSTPVRAEVPMTPTPTVPVPVPVADPRVYVTSNVPGEVIDVADGAVIGTTGEAGFTLPHGGEARPVLVRAVGYEDLALTLEPVAERHFEALLKPQKKRIAGKPGGKPGDKVKPSEVPTVSVPSEPKPVGSMGLKNPFQTREP